MGKMGLAHFEYLARSEGIKEKLPLQVVFWEFHEYEKDRVGLFTSKTYQTGKHCPNRLHKNISQCVKLSTKL